MKSTVLVSLALISLAVLGAPRAHAGKAIPAKVGYIDLNRTLNETKLGRDAKSRLEKDKAKRQKDIDKAQEDLKRQAEELEKQRVVLKPEVLRKKEAELQNQYVQLQNTFMKLQQELTRREAELTQEILKSAGKIIEDIARRDGYTLILEKSESAVLWADPLIDVTDEVNKRLDASPAPAPAAAKGNKK